MKARSYEVDAGRCFAIGTGTRRGYTLFTCLIFVSVITLIGATLAAVVMPEMRAATYHRQKRASFYQAEAVVQYTLMRINQGLSDDTLDLGGDRVPVDFALPEGIEGDPVTELRRLANGEWYTFSATGRSDRSTSVVEVAVRRPNLLMAGMFGDEEVALMPKYEVYSFDSRVSLNPHEADSTGEATVGVNGALIVRAGVVVDGKFLLGETLDGVTPSPPAGYDSTYVGQIDPDPLGIDGGVLAAAFEHYRAAEHNDNASAGIVNNRVVVKNKETLTLTGGNYYLNLLDISGPHQTLHVDTEPGNPVVIYLDGEMNVQTGADINYAEGCGPGDLLIYSKSTEQIKINPNSRFQGLIYAPHAEVWVNPGGGLYGVIWAGSAQLQPGGMLFIDTALLGRFPANHVVMEQWNQRL